MQAVILAGGKGTRLRPLTSALPKPLVPLGETPIIEVVLRQLRHFGFREAIVSTGHLAELIQAFCGDGRKWGLKLRYVHEDKPLSTAGALKLIRGLEKHFLTINGDILTNLDLRKLVDFHRRSKAIATLGVCERETVVSLGVVGLDEDNRLKSYVEKPSYKYLVSMGVNVFDRRALEHIRKNEFLGIPELAHRLLSAGEKVMGFKNQAQWLDIGRVEDYQAAQDLFATPRGRARYLRG